MASSRSLGSLTLDLVAKTGGFKQGMDQAARTADTKMREIERRAYDFGHNIGTAIRAGTIAVAAGVTAALVAVKKTIDSMDEMSKAAQKVGVSTEVFSTLAFAAKLSGVGVDDLTGAMGKLNKAQGDALKTGSVQQKLFQALGISVKDASGNMRSSTDVLKDFADRFKELKGGPEALAAGMNIFGRSFQNLVPLMKDGAAGISDAQAEAAALGLTLDGNAAKAAEHFNDNINRLKGALQGIVQTVATDLLPMLTDWTDKVVALAKDHDTLKASSEQLKSVLNSLAIAVHLGAQAFYFIEGAVQKATVSVAAGVERIGAVMQVRDGLMHFDTSKVKAGWAEFNQINKNGSDQWVTIDRETNAKIAASRKAAQSLLGQGGGAKKPGDDTTGLFVTDPRAAADAAARAKKIRDALASTGSGGKAAAGVDALAKAYQSLYSAVQDLSGNDSPTAKIYADEAKQIRQLAQLGATAIKAGADVARVQAVVAQGVASIQKQTQDKLDAPARAVKEYTASLNAQLLVQKQSIAEQVRAIGLGSQEAENIRALTKVQQDGAAAVAKLTLAHQLHSDNMTDEQFDGELKALKKYWSDYYAITKDGQKQVSDAQADWHNGVNKAMGDFMDEMHNVAKQAEDFTHTLIDGFGDAFASFASGAESAKDAFGSFIDSMYKQALKFLADKAIQALFDSFKGGSNATPGSTAGGLGSLIGNFMNAFGFGSGHASGGGVQAGMIYPVNEHRPELLSIAGVDYLMMGNQNGYVKPSVPQTQSRRGGNTTINVAVQPTSTRRSADQIATEIARKQRLATSRNG